MPNGAESPGVKVQLINPLKMWGPTKMSFWSLKWTQICSRTHKSLGGGVRSGVSRFPQNSCCSRWI